MKKYFAGVITIAIAIGLLQSCNQKSVKNTSSEPIIQVPAVTQEANYEYTGTVDEIPIGNQVAVLSYEEEDYGNYSNLSDEQMSVMVNEGVYQNMLAARNNFNRLYDNGEVSTQMRNMGTSLSDEEANYINSSMRNNYDLICNYIQYYENGNKNACYDTGVLLYDSYTHGLTKDYLYNIMVARNLPDGYQSSIHYDEYRNIYDTNGNINLENGNQIHLIGASDAIVSPVVEDSDQHNVMYARSEWYRDLPNIILDQYGPIYNNTGDDGICYVWNETRAENACRREWASLKEEGSSIYGFNPTDTKITWVDEANIYVYESQDGDIYGPLDYDSNNRVDYIYEVQDALVSQTGDVYALDSHVKDMVYSQDAKGYNK